MKKINILSLVFVSLFLLPLLVSADVIPSNSHPVNRCVKIINLSSFPEITLTGFISGPMVDKDDKDDTTFTVKANECLSAGYKFNTLDIYWNTADKIGVIDTDKILYNNLLTYGGYIDNKSPINKQTVEYSITKSQDGKYSLYKSKTTTGFNNGDPERIDSFNNLGQFVKEVYKDDKITKSLKMGLKNDLQVKHLQLVLNKALGLSLATDGSFGLSTKKAVMSFQKNKGLFADGAVGTKTISELNKISIK